MGVNNRYKNTGYSLGQGPLTDIFPAPIVSTRDPLGSDLAPIGQEWVNKSTNAVFFLSSIVANVGNWVDVAGGAGSFASLTVTPGPVSLTGTTNINTSGAAVTSIGTGGTGAVNIGNATGNTSVTGGLTASGSIFATNGSVSAGNTAAAATSSNLQILKSRSGGIITTGDTLGNLIFAGNDGVTNITGAAIVSTSSGTIAANRIPANLTFLTHPDAATPAVVRMTIQPAGNVVVAAPDSGVGLSVSSGVTVATGGLVVSTAGQGVTLGGGAQVLSGAGDPNGSVTAPQGSLYLNTTGNSVSTRAFINSNSGTTWVAVTTAS